MNLSRRQMFGVAGLSAAILADPSHVGAETAQFVEKKVEVIKKDRVGYKNKLAKLTTMGYKIRIRNDFTWTVVFGIFGMRSNMQWRQAVKGSGGIFESGLNKPIDGGERIAVIWDQFTEAYLDHQFILVDHDLTVQIDNTGKLTVS